MDEVAFAEATERHRRELRVHCYRMLGSFDEAEYLVQETFSRAWKGIKGFEGRLTFRAWLYRIATNACLDALDGRVVGDATVPPSRSDDLLAVIHCLPLRQRAVLILRDVLGWSAEQTADLLDGTVASADSALRRARSALKERLPERRTDLSVAPAEEDESALRRYLAAVERADAASLSGLLTEGVHLTMPPYSRWFEGRQAVIGALAAGWDTGAPQHVGRIRMVPTRVNGQVAAAAYVQLPGETVYQAFAISVFRTADGRIAEITVFHDPGLFPVFGLHAELR